ncbi:MAG: hypothetical protein ACR652_16445 [Methylocystis sp.]|uniref:hypothetical protein n=1 Tax=Methylocystis sp. TaxID=1911079 RepID=UPI003DA461D8
MLRHVFAACFVFCLATGAGATSAIAQGDMGATGIVVLEGMIRQQNSPCAVVFDPFAGYVPAPACLAAHPARKGVRKHK